MSEEDRRRWDDTWSRIAGPVPSPALPEPFAAFAERFPTTGRALDLACGTGQASVWLAVRGLDVLGVDVSPVAVAAARDLAARHGVASRCRFEVFDLDFGLPPGPPVEVIVCHQFREPRLDRAVLERLAPGGLLAVAVLSEVGRGPGPFRAAPGELTRAFSGLSRVIGSAEADGRAWLVGHR